MEEVDGRLLESAEELINRSDKELLALSLGVNPLKKDNYQIAMALRFKNSLSNLKQEINGLRKSLNMSSWVMGAMTFLILVLTGVLAWMTISSV